MLLVVIHKVYIIHSCGSCLEQKKQQNAKAFLKMCFIHGPEKVAEAN